MIKRTDSTGNWSVTNNQTDPTTQQLALNASVIENDYLYKVKYTEDSFELINNNVEVNASGGTYLYKIVYDNDNGSGKSKYPKATVH